MHRSAWRLTVQAIFTLNDQVDRFLGVRRIDAATNLMTTIAGTDFYEIKGNNGLRATDALNVSGFALDALGNLITFSSGTNGSAVSKVDTSVSAISFPYNSNRAAYAYPFVGTPYPNANAETVNLSNIGTTTLNLLSPTSGSNPAVTGAAYKLNDPATAGCPSVAAGAANATLAPGTSLLLCSGLHAQRWSGPTQGRIALTDNSLNVASSTKAISLSGYGDPLPLTLSPAAVVFPNTLIGTASAAQTITVTNTGNFTTTMVVVSITGVSASSFFADQYLRHLPFPFSILHHHGHLLAHDGNRRAQRGRLGVQRLPDTCANGRP